VSNAPGPKAAAAVRSRGSRAACAGPTAAADLRRYVGAWCRSSPPDDIGRGLWRQFADQARHIFRLSVIWPNSLVGSPGVSDRAHQASATRPMSAMCARKSSAPIAQLKSDRDRSGVGRTEVQTPAELPRQQSSLSFVGDVPETITCTRCRAQLGNFGDGVERGLSLSVSEDGLDPQISPAVEQALERLAIGFAQIVEATAGSPVRYIRRDRACGWSGGLVAPSNKRACRPRPSPPVRLAARGQPRAPSSCAHMQVRHS